jgi:MOSC domain-containing protein YiiM
MIILGEVLGLFSAKEGESGLPRPKKETLFLRAGYGIEGDKFAGRKLNQSVMIVGTKAYNLAKSKGVLLEYGSLGENILFDFDPHEFAMGTKLKIGESAIIKITKNCTICKHLAIFDEKLPKILEFHRGVYCKIIESGEIKAGDRVTLA